MAAVCLQQDTCKLKTYFTGIAIIDQGIVLTCLSRYANSAGFHVALISDGLVSSSHTNDADLVAGAQIWREQWGRPSQHNSHDKGYNHFGGSGWRGCGHSRSDRIQCCADECVRLGPRVCAKFAIWAKSSTVAPCCCHIISAADAASPIVGAGSKTWSTWSPAKSHLHGGLSSLTNQKKCDMASFTKRADAVNAACCARENACRNGMPKQCHLDCAQKLIPFYDECKKLIAAMTNIKEFDSLASMCLAIPKKTMWGAVSNLAKQGCNLIDYGSTDDGGNGHRRLEQLLPAVHAVNHSTVAPIVGDKQMAAPKRQLQGLNFHHHPKHKNCPIGEAEASFLLLAYCSFCSLSTGCIIIRLTQTETREGGQQLLCPERQECLQ